MNFVIGLQHASDCSCSGDESMLKVTEYRRLLLPGGRIEGGKIEEATCITVGLFLALDR